MKNFSSALAKIITKDTKKITIVQMFSMRLRTGSEYNVLADGNLTMTLHRIVSIAKSNQQIKFVITVPTKTVGLSALKMLMIKLRCSNIEFEPKAFYSTNAAKTRKTIANYSINEIVSDDTDLIVSEFSLLDRNDPLHRPRIYNYNISSDAALKRGWIDDMFNDMVASLSHDSKPECFVLNAGQKTKLCKALPENNIVVETEWFDRDLIEIIMKQYVADRVVKEFVKMFSINKNSVFFPFRLTDKVYKFDELVKSDKLIFVTNPNSADIKYDNVVDLSRVFEYLDSKTMYYSALAAVKQVGLAIPCFEDPRLIMHQTIVEMEFLASDNLRFYSSYDKFITNNSCDDTKSFVRTLFKTR